MTHASWTSCSGSCLRATGRCWPGARNGRRRRTGSVGIEIGAALTSHASAFCSAAPPAVNLAAHQRKRVLIDGRGIPRLDRCEVRLARLVTGAGSPAMGPQEVRGRTERAGGVVEVAGAVV